MTTCVVLSRQEIIEYLGWFDPEVGQSLPKDPQCILVLGGPSDKYTDEELTLIVEFAQRETEWYDNLFSRQSRRSANFFIFDKEADDRWLRIKASYTQGVFYSPSLEHAIHLFSRRW